MTALNFNPSFVPDIESGRKRRTIRRVRKRGNPEPGKPLQLFTGLRTSKCKKILDAICTRVRPVEINDWWITLDGRKLFWRDAPSFFCLPHEEFFEDNFARANGFDCFSSMVDFFEKQYGLPFKGQLIEWRIDNDQDR